MDPRKQCAEIGIGFRSSYNARTLAHLAHGKSLQLRRNRARLGPGKKGEALLIMVNHDTGSVLGI